MSKALLIYSTVEGQTHNIISKIAEDIAPLEYDLFNINELPAINWDDYSVVLIGASIRYGHFRKNVISFIEQNTAILNTKKSAFFGVCVTARKEGKDTPETSVYTRKLFQKIDWQPDLKALFAGALYYPQYGFFDRNMIRLIMRLGGEKNHDMRQNYSYTDWDKVNLFAKQFSGLASSQ